MTRSVRLDGCRKDRTIALEVGTAAITDPASNTVFSEMVAFEEPTLVLSVLRNMEAFDLEPHHEPLLGPQRDY